MNARDKATLVTHAKQKALNQLKKELARAEHNAISVANEHEALKQEVVNAIQGNSVFPSDLLCELIEKAAQKRLFAYEALATLQTQTQEDSKKLADIQHMYQDLLHWSKTFDSSNPATQKMIAAYMIKSVHVRKGYALTIEFNQSVTQFQE